MDNLLDSYRESLTVAKLFGDGVICSVERAKERQFFS